MTRPMPCPPSSRTTLHPSRSASSRVAAPTSPRQAPSRRWAGVDVAIGAGEGWHTGGTWGDGFEAGTMDTETTVRFIAMALASFRAGKMPRPLRACTYGGSLGRWRYACAPAVCVAGLSTRGSPTRPWSCSPETGRCRHSGPPSTHKMCNRSHAGGREGFFANRA
jgi:hypothetical protein